MNFKEALKAAGYHDAPFIEHLEKPTAAALEVERMAKQVAKIKIYWDMPEEDIHSFFPNLLNVCYVKARGYDIPVFECESAKDVSEFMMYCLEKANVETANVGFDKNGYMRVEI